MKPKNVSTMPPTSNGFTCKKRQLFIRFCGFEIPRDADSACMDFMAWQWKGQGVWEMCLELMK